MWEGAENNVRLYSPVNRVGSVRWSPTFSITLHYQRYIGYYEGSGRSRFRNSSDLCCDKNVGGLVVAANWDIVNIIVLTHYFLWNIEEKNQVLNKSWSNDIDKYLHSSFNFSMRFGHTYIHICLLKESLRINAKNIFKFLRNRTKFTLDIHEQ